MREVRHHKVVCARMRERGTTKKRNREADEFSKATKEERIKKIEGGRGLNGRKRRRTMRIRKEEREEAALVQACLVS